VSILLADEGVSGMLGKIECFATAFFRILKTFDSYTDVQDDGNSSKVHNENMVRVCVRDKTKFLYNVYAVVIWQLFLIGHLCLKGA